MIDHDDFDLDQCYNRNPKLKKTGVKQQWSWDQVSEITACRNDVVYFAAHYCKILNLDEGLVNFNMYQYQKDLVDIMHKNRFSIFLLPRQMGKSITVAAYLLHAAIFNPGYLIAVMANKGDQSREIVGRIKLMYEELPWFLQVGVSSWNEGSIKFGNRTKIMSSGTKGSSIRGKSINILYLDEFAFVENDVAFYTGTYPTITSGKTTKVIITSTPNGMNMFYKIWTDANFGRNEFKFKRVFWNENPNRDEAWKKQQLSNMTEKQFAQEFDCVVEETFVTVRNTISEQVERITMLELYDRMVGTEEEGVVYKITRSDSLSYIGIAKDFRKRLRSHQKSKRFSLGIDSSEILFSGRYSECENLEGHFILKHGTYKNGLNLTPDGKGKVPGVRFNTYGHHYSEESRQKMSIAAKKRGANNIGYKHSAETKKKWSEIRKGKAWGPIKLDSNLIKSIVEDYLLLPINQSTIDGYLKVSQRGTLIPENQWKSGNGANINLRKIKIYELAKRYDLSRPTIEKALVKSNV